MGRTRCERRANILRKWFDLMMANQKTLRSSRRPSKASPLPKRGVRSPMAHPWNGSLKRPSASMAK